MNNKNFGVTEFLPGTNKEFTHVIFLASDVPEGTVLFTADDSNTKILKEQAVEIANLKRIVSINSESEQTKKLKELDEEVRKLRSNNFLLTETNEELRTKNRSLERSCGSLNSEKIDLSNRYEEARGSVLVLRHANKTFARDNTDLRKQNAKIRKQISDLDKALKRLMMVNESNGIVIENLESQLKAKDGAA